MTARTWDVAGAIANAQESSAAAVHPVQAPPLDRKAFATAQARAALVGFELVAMPGGGFVSSKWGHIRALATMADVEAFLQQIGA